VKKRVIEPITFSDWAAPIVLVLKKDGTVRICGDYKLTVNQAIKADSYPYQELMTFSPHWLEGNHSQSWT